MKYIVALITALSLYLLLRWFPLLDNILLIGIIILIYYFVAILLLSGELWRGYLKHKAIGWGIILGTTAIVVLALTFLIVLVFSFIKQ